MLFRIPFGKCEQSMLVNLKTVERVILRNSKIEFYYGSQTSRAPSCVAQFNDFHHATKVYAEITQKIGKMNPPLPRWDQPQPDLWAMGEVESYQPQKMEQLK